ncbi:MAG: GNAT family N-acetyltransferase [Acidobacteriaceae bacterium]
MPEAAKHAPELADSLLAQRLDNPIWSALTTDHAALALGDDRARRYPADIGPLSGMPAQSPESYASLARLAGPGGAVGLFLQEPLRSPEGWTLLRSGVIDQMIAPQPLPLASAALPGVDLRRLTAADAPAMVELAHLTEPGPFQLRTLELGTFYGILQSGRLLAMAGKRLHVPGAIEVSGVCTHPDARGRGYARHLMSRVMEEIVQAGRMPFLHSLASNHAAIRVYESLGFVRRLSFELAAIRRDG